MKPIVSSPYGIDVIWRNDMFKCIRMNTEIVFLGGFRGFFGVFWFFICTVV